MDQNREPELSKEIDIQSAQRAAIAQKIDEYNKKNHPDKQPSEVPSNLPVYDIDPKAKNEADIAEICRLIEEKSLKKQNATKMKIKFNAQNVATTIVLSITIIGSLAAFIKAAENKVKSDIKKAELKAAVEYIDENYLSEVLFNAGFQITGTDSNGNPIYQFNRSNALKAVEKLTEKGLSTDSAKFYVALKFNFDQRLYPENMTADMYYIQQGYKIGENENEALLVPDGGIRPYISAQQDPFIEGVNRIKEEGRTNNARG